MNEFFAAQNCGRGFVSHFSRVFGGYSRIYVIKGGPGCGKSRLMRDLGEAAKSKALEVEYYYCSSDPISLDGMAIPSLDLCMIDGTAPHVWNERLPGAVEQLVNLGEFWDEKELSSLRCDIERLSAKKSEAYKAAYRMLSAAREVDEELDALTEPAILGDKLNAAASRILRGMRDGEGRETVRQLEAITGRGRMSLGSFDGETRVCVVGAGYATRRVVDAIYRESAARKLDREVSFDALDPSHVAALRLDGRIAITSGEVDGDVKRLNAARFVAPEVISEHRGRIKFLERCEDALVKSAVEKLADASTIHAEVEKLYATAMDYTKKQRYCSTLVKRILG